MLEVIDLHKRYGDTVALDRVKFQVADGEMFGLLADQGVGSIPWSPLAKGRLARPWGEQTARSASRRGAPG